jgi:hypothetical protein
VLVRHDSPPGAGSGRTMGRPGFPGVALL